ncbi:hypothetical protein [uncultured Draconibacterium sp.]|uniref:hypothetical protein n=1 Tax=uncultured Draconibacterium sp. TaxID=1573823 RepID=UPI0029C74B22|nr:hypothetical protein [uncultured Draconibacterium sp.]
MKKQILFLTVFVAALLAGMNSYGQYVNSMTGAPTCTPAVPLSCLSDADELHPLPGEVYTYTITTDPATVGDVHWFVTDESDIITSATLGTPVLQPNRDVVDGDYILTASAHYDTPGASKTIDISWKTFDTSNEVLLVAYVEGAAGCSDNVEVYRIEPSFSFTLDVAGLLDAGGLGAEECISPVESAVYDGTNLTMDYGENWVFFSVNAANFVDSWEPTFSAVAANGSTIGTIEWAYPTDAQANTNWNVSGTPVDAVVAGGAVGAGGECIVVRVQVDHGSVEHNNTTAAEVVTLSIDGVMYDPATDGYGNAALADLDEPASSGACVNDVTDVATYTLTPRPALVDAIPDTPNPTDFEPKN